MSRYVELRLSVPADDAVQVSGVQAAVIEIFQHAGIKKVTIVQKKDGDLPLPDVEASIYFCASNVKIGSGIGRGGKKPNGEPTQ